jgi:hypothetical protein
VSVKRISQFLLVGLLLVVVVFDPAFTQGPGGRGGRGGRRGGGFGGMMDPNAIFNMYSAGKDTIDVNNLKVPEFMQRFQSGDQIKQAMQAFLQKKGVTNGQMTREQYLQYNEERRQEMMSRWGGMRGSKGGATPPAPGTAAAPSAGSTAPSAPAGSPEIDAEARRQFDILDINKDGSLDRTEAMAAGRLSRDFDRWDTNRDGKIQFEEYLAFARDRMSRGRGNQQGGGFWPQPIAPVEEERRPTVYRVGKLPKELPPWFAQLDRDRDGQVGLYEWKQAGRPLNDFLARDLNGDGFLTAEEVLRYEKAQKAAGGGTQAKTGSAPAALTPDARPGGFRMRGKSRRGG